MSFITSFHYCKLLSGIQTAHKRLDIVFIEIFCSDPLKHLGDDEEEANEDGLLDLDLTPKTRFGINA